MAETVAISFRVAREKARELDKLAKSTDRAKSWLLEQALDAYLETQAWHVASIEEGLAQAKRGETVSHDKVKRWLNSWGTESETKPPR